MPYIPSVSVQASPDSAGGKSIRRIRPGGRARPAFWVIDVPEIDVEAPEGDAAEQHADVSEDRDEPLTGVHADRANEADLIEQARVVSLDEDDYR